MDTVLIVDDDNLIADSGNGAGGGLCALKANNAC
jgi:hypothetical protein